MRDSGLTTKSTSSLKFVRRRNEILHRQHFLIDRLEHVRIEPVPEHHDNVDVRSLDQLAQLLVLARLVMGQIIGNVPGNEADRVLEQGFAVLVGGDT